MKKITIGLLACWLALQGLAAEELNWQTDLPKAQEQAKKEGKLILMDFTGSDWCPFCLKLRNEVFSTPEFVEYANKHFVPVMVDFPHTKEISPELRRANKELYDKYKIEGLPAILVLDANGKKLGFLSYEPGGPQPFIEKLSKFKS